MYRMTILGIEAAADAVPNNQHIILNTTLILILTSILSTDLAVWYVFVKHCMIHTKESSCQNSTEGGPQD
jgi:hypothetical protein